MSKMKSTGSRLFVASVVLLFSPSVFALDICEPEVNASLRGLSEISRHIEADARTEEIRDLETRLAELHRPGCAEKIWPKNKLTKTPIEILDGKARKTYRWNSQTQKLEEGRPYTTADERAPAFNFHKPNGDGGITLNVGATPQRGGGGSGGARPPLPQNLLCESERKAEMEFMKTHVPRRQLGPSDGAMSLLAHENFHNVDQDPGNPLHQHTGGCHWQLGQGERSLGGDAEKIKFARQNMMKALKDALETKDPAARTEALAQVKAWAAQIPADVREKLRHVDRHEGGAEYVGMMSNLYGKLGCSATPAQVKEEVKKSMNDRYMSVPQSVDQQAYLLGSAAGAILDEMGVKDWKEQVASGKTPLEVLLAQNEIQKIPIQAARPDPLLQQASGIVGAVSSCMQKAVDGIVQQVVDNPEDYVLVEMEKIPFSTMAGSFLAKSPTGDVPVVAEASANGDLSFKQGTLLRLEGLCPSSSSNFILVPKSLISGNQVSGRQGATEFSGRVPPLSGRSWNGAGVACR